MTVGVVLPAYNGAEYIGTAIESVLAQEYEAFELVVVDDGSTDATVDVVREFDDPRVRLLRNETNRGIGASLNRGVAAVSGEILAFLDHDDRWQPTKLSRHVATHRRTGAALVYSDVREIDSDGQIKGTRNAPDPAASGPPLVRQVLFQGGSFIVTMSSVTVTRTAWERVGGATTECSVSGDVDFYLRLTGSHAFTRVATPLVDKRDHGRNASDDYRAIYADHERILERALDWYAFLQADDEQRKRARMAYRRATSALAAGNVDEAARFARESLAHDRRVRPALVLLLAMLDRATGRFKLGHHVYRHYDRFSTRRSR